MINKNKKNINTFYLLILSFKFDSKVMELRRHRHQLTQDNKLSVNSTNEIK